MKDTYNDAEFNFENDPFGGWKLIGLGIGLLIFIVIYCLIMTACHNPTPKEIISAPATHYTDKSGRDHAVKQVVTIETFRDQFDSMCKILKIKESQIQGLTVAVAQARGRVVMVKDTSGQYNYHDNWSDFSFNNKDEQSVLDYRISDSLKFITYTKRKWFLGRETTFIDAYSLNPNITIASINSGVKVAQDKGRFGFGPYVGIGTNGRDFRVTVGLSLHYSIFRF